MKIFVKNLSVVGLDIALQFVVGVIYGLYLRAVHGSEAMTIAVNPANYGPVMMVITGILGLILIGAVIALPVTLIIGIIRVIRGK